MRRYWRVLAYVSGAAIGIFAIGVGYLLSQEADLVFYGGVGDTLELPVLAEAVPEPWDTIRVETRDSVHILLLEARQGADDSVPWVVFFYGAGQHLADASSRARYEILRSLGVNVLAVEYRGYGGSEQVQPSERGLYEDGRTAWAYLTETRTVSPRRIVLFGYSLGTGVAIELATEVHPGGLITQGTYTSLPDVAAVWYPWIPPVVLRHMMSTSFANLAKATSVDSPWLLIHGRLDEEVPIDQAERIVKTKGGPRRLVAIESGHTDMETVARDAMTAAIAGFLNDLGWRERVQ